MGILRPIAVLVSSALALAACGSEGRERPQLPSTPTPPPETATDSIQPVAGLPFVLVVRDEVVAGDHRGTELHRLSGTLSTQAAGDGVEIDFHVQRSRQITASRVTGADDSADAHVVVRASTTGEVEPGERIGADEALLREQLWALPSSEPTQAWFAVAARTHVQEGTRSLTSWRSAEVSGEASVERSLEGGMRRSVERFEAQPSVTLERLEAEGQPLAIEELTAPATVALRAERLRSTADGITQQRHAVRETRLAGTEIRRETWFRVGAEDTPGFEPIAFEVEPARPPLAERCPETSEVVIWSANDAWVATSDRRLTHTAARVIPDSRIGAGRPGGVVLTLANYPVQPDFPASPSRGSAGGLAERTRLRLDLTFRAQSGAIQAQEFPARDYAVQEQERYVGLRVWTYTGVISGVGGDAATVQITAIEEDRICGTVDVSDEWTSARGSFVARVAPAG